MFEFELIVEQWWDKWIVVVRNVGFGSEGSLVTLLKGWVVMRCEIKNQRGVFFVMLAILLGALLTLVALLFGSGILSSNETRLQNATNLAALGGLERFARITPAPASPPLSYQTRAVAARARINNILDEQLMLYNTAQGPGSLGNAGFPSENRSGGNIRIGNWYAARPAAAPFPCGPNEEDYPCFIEGPDPLGTGNAVLPANAVKVEAKTPNSFTAPLMNFLGVSGLTANSESIAAVVPRCSVFLLDAGYSSFSETHPNYTIPNIPVPGGPPGVNFKAWNGASPLSPDCTSESGTCGESPTGPVDFWCIDGTGSPRNYNLSKKPILYPCPRNRALFAYDVNLFDPGGINLGLTNANYGFCGENCRNLNNLYLNTQKRLFCNMAVYNGVRRDGAQNPNEPAFPQSACNYSQTRASPYGSMRVDIDAANPPQPMHSFLKGFNAGSRLLLNQTSSTDRIGMLVFREVPFYRFPANPPAGPGGLSSDAGFIAEATNFDRFIANQSPNFFELGWFSRMDDNRPQIPGTSYIANRGSNVVAAISAAIDLLQNPANCLPSSQKSIILASDGIMNCRTPDNGASWTCQDNHNSGPDGIDNTLDDYDGYTYYLEDENYLLRTNFDTMGDPADSILNRLVKNRIQFTAIIAGRSGQNLLIRRVPGETPGSYQYISYDQARSYSFHAFPKDNSGNYLADPYVQLVGPGADDHMLVDPGSDEVSLVGISDLCNRPLHNGCATASDRSRYAFMNQWDNRVPFRRPNAVLAELALRTGGYYCPLLPRGSASDYEDAPGGPPNTPDQNSRLKDTVLEAMVSSGSLNQLRLSQNMFYRDIGEEAADCVAKTLGPNPFILVREP